MFITCLKAKIGFTIREETFCSLITTIDLLIILEPSQRKGEYTLHNFKFINYQRNMCVLILIAHDEEHMKHLEAHGLLILQ